MKLRCGFAAALLVYGVGCSAAETAKPGLWEYTTHMQGAMGEAMSDSMAKMQKQLDSMPPEKRKMMQEMMEKRGMAMGAGAGGGMTYKLCLTQEMVDRKQFAQRQSEHQNDCTHTNSAQSGNTMQFSFTCTKPPGKGEGQITFNGPDSYSVKMTTTTTVNGNPQTMSMQSDARWLGSDCGSVKPIVVPK